MDDERGNRERRGGRGGGGRGGGREPRKPLEKGQIKLPKAAKVKNKAPAQVQITAEQLLREAKERDLEIVAPPARTKIHDPEELKSFQLKRRKEFEDNIRKNRLIISNWIRYAKWEETQSELQRARSVFERALDVDHRNISIWLQYAEMEMRNRQANHARNIWDRAIAILPRANQFWYKYTYMEEMLTNVSGCRQVFERWMEWEPEEQAWLTYIKFELRYQELERARAIYQRFIHCHSDVRNWIRYARFEEQHGAVSAARQVFERAVDFFGEEHVDEKLLMAFSRFEENQKEHERARVIYKYALDHLPKERTTEIMKAYTIHEKKFGDRPAIENVVVSKRKLQYEEQVKSNPFNYDAWFDYLRLLENEDVDVSTVRDTFERAIANVPPQQEKRFWRRYVYLWINYAVYEELVVKDAEKTREVYKACVELVPHKVFTFAKVWLLFAQFEVRQKNLQAARKILGAAIGKCPKDKLFRGYIDLELQLREFDRCRILYQKFLEFTHDNCTAWIKFAELETLLGDTDRARGIYELAIHQPALDMPEVLWKAYIDFEVGQEEFPNARRLYQRLLQRTQHVKVWISLAQFELTAQEDTDRIGAAREVYQRAHASLKNSEDKEERLMLLESWKRFEEENGSEGSRADVEKEMPKRVKKRRKIQTEDGSDAGWEEYFDYIFPSDEASQSSLKLLEIAKRWKERQAAAASTAAGDEEAPSTSAGAVLPKEEEDEEDTRGKERTGDSDTDISESESSESESEEEGAGTKPT